MTDDLLKRATGALRDETAEPELRSGLTRARLLDSAAKKERAGGLRFRWIVPFVLTLGAGTALAHVTHQHFPEVWNALVPEALEQPVSPEQEAPRARKPKVKKPAPALTVPEPLSTPAPAPAFAPEAAPAQQPAPAPELAKPSTPKPARPKRTPPIEITKPADAPAPVVSIKPAATETPAPAPAESAELALFRRAMRLHDAKDGGAIAAWDDFLRVAPKSPLATEARYNRALSLVRANRSREAKAALAPFANGEYGAYRKREAAQLLQALEHRDGGVAD